MCALCGAAPIGSSPSSKLATSFKKDREIQDPGLADIPNLSQESKPWQNWQTTGEDLKEEEEAKKSVVDEKNTLDRTTRVGVGVEYWYK